MRAAAARRTAGLLAGQIGLIALAILLVALCTPLHIALLRQTGAEARMGLNEAQLREVACAMTASMRGEGEAGLEKWFMEDEIEHMRDVRGLVLLGWRVVGACAAIWALGVFSARGLGKRARANCALAALIAVGLLGAGIAIAFAVDFYGAFVAFHRLFFRRNTLWLMDPRIHRMVVVYNEAFFTRAVAVIGLISLASLLPLVRAAMRGRR